MDGNRIRVRLSDHIHVRCHPRPEIQGARRSKEGPGAGGRPGRGRNHENGTVVVNSERFPTKYCEAGLKFTWVRLCSTTCLRDIINLFHSESRSDAGQMQRVILSGTTILYTKIQKTNSYTGRFYTGRFYTDFLSDSV